MKVQTTWRSIENEDEKERAAPLFLQKRKRDHCVKLNFSSIAFFRWNGYRQAPDNRWGKGDTSLYKAWSVHYHFRYYKRNNPSFLTFFQEFRSLSWPLPSQLFWISRSEATAQSQRANSSTKNANMSLKNFVLASMVFGTYHFAIHCLFKLNSSAFIRRLVTFWAWSWHDDSLRLPGVVFGKLRSRPVFF